MTSILARSNLEVTGRITAYIAHIDRVYRIIVFENHSTHQINTSATAHISGR
jgi:hypothetical protein